MSTPSLMHSIASNRALQLLSLVTVAMAASSCGNAATDASPPTADAPVSRRAYQAAAFVLDISLQDGTRRVSAPIGDARSFSAGASPQLAGEDRSPSRSLLGAGVVDLVASNFSAGAIGAVVPGRILIAFDLSVVNRLAGIRLITSTAPAPPAGASGVQAFALEMFAIPGFSTSGTFVLSEPAHGPVIASADWNGAPHNFFNDQSCNNSVTSDCFRYESFGPVEPLGASPPQRVGVLIEPTVRQFRVNLILAADLLAVP